MNKPENQNYPEGGQSETTLGVGVDPQAKSTHNKNKALIRILRWWYTVTFATIPFLASIAINHLRTQPAGDEFQNAADLCVFTLVISATVIADLFETGPVIGWSIFQPFVALPLSLCLSYSAFLYGFSAFLYGFGVQMPKENVRPEFSKEGMFFQSSRLAMVCAAVCTIVELVIAIKEWKR